MSAERVPPPHDDGSRAMAVARSCSTPRQAPERSGLVGGPQADKTGIRIAAFAKAIQQAGTDHRRRRPALSGDRRKTGERVEHQFSGREVEAASTSPCPEKVAGAAGARRTDMKAVGRGE